METIVTKVPLIVICRAITALPRGKALIRKKLRERNPSAYRLLLFLRAVIDDYPKRCGIDTKPELDATILP